MDCPPSPEKTQSHLRTAASEGQDRAWDGGPSLHLLVISGSVELTGHQMQLVLLPARNEDYSYDIHAGFYK